MTQLIHCYGCGAQVHVSAAACPKCGAPALSAVPSTRQAQAAPSVAVSNVVAWILAFAPLIGWFLQGIVAFGVYGDDETAAMHAWSTNAFWYINAIVNVAFSLADAAKLRKAGIDTKSLQRFVFIPPVYLFKRSNVLVQGKGDFVVWVICFVLVILSRFGMESGS